MGVFTVWDRRDSLFALEESMLEIVIVGSA